MKYSIILHIALTFSSGAYAQERGFFSTTVSPKDKNLDKLNKVLLKAAKMNKLQKVLFCLSQGATPDKRPTWLTYSNDWVTTCFPEFSTSSKFHTGRLVLEDAISPKLDIQIFKILLAASSKKSFLGYSWHLLEQAFKADREDLAKFIMQLREYYGIGFDTAMYGKITMDLLTSLNQTEKWVVFLVSLGLAEKDKDLLFHRSSHTERYHWAQRLGLDNEVYEKLIAQGEAVYEPRKQEYNGAQTFILNRCQVPEGEELAEQTIVPVTFVGSEEFHKRIAAFDKFIDDTLQSVCAAKPFPKEITNLIIAYQGDLDFYQMMQCMHHNIQFELETLQMLIKNQKNIEQPAKCCTIQ